MTKHFEMSEQPPSSNQLRPQRDQAGFNLIEMLVVMAILSIAMIALVPNIIQSMNRAKLKGSVRDVSTLMLRAKQEAVKRNTDVVFYPDTATGEIVAFANIDRDSEFRYQPDTSVDLGRADFEIFRQPLETHIRFGGPAASVEVTRDLTTVKPTGSELQGIVFQSNGSVEATGALRLADAQDANHFEIEIAPRATARVHVLKFNHALADFVTQGRDGNGPRSRWVWYSS